MGIIKNWIGDFKGYNRCPVTNDTYWKTDVVSIPYSHDSGHYVLAKALNELSSEQIAQKVFNIAKNKASSSYKFSLEEISRRITKGNIVIQRGKFN